MPNAKLPDLLRAWSARPRRARRHAFHYEHVLGTSLELQVVAEREDAARRAESAVLAEIDRLEPILSGWSGTSELARWENSQGVDTLLSSELIDVLYASERWRTATCGAFDPAAQLLIERRRAGASAAELSELARSLDAARHEPLWIVDRVARTARRRTRHPVSLDAIAKGYVVTRAAVRGREVPGVHEVLLNVGGDVQHFGARGVDVAVAHPFAPAENAPPVAVVRLRNAALATSGGYRRGDVIDGRRISHIVDPRTGRPAGRIASASVFAPDGATADALSTAFSVMEPRESVALADALPDVGCLLVDADGGITASAAWTARAVRARGDHTDHRALS